MVSMQKKRKNGISFMLVIGILSICIPTYAAGEEIIVNPTIEIVNASVPRLGDLQEASSTGSQQGSHLPQTGDGTQGGTTQQGDSNNPIKDSHLTQQGQEYQESQTQQTDQGDSSDESKDKTINHDPTIDNSKDSHLKTPEEIEEGKTSPLHTPDEIIKEAQGFINKGSNENTIVWANLQSASNTLYNILLSIGIFAAIAIGMYLGVKFMLASAEDKAKVKESLIPYIAGCVIVFGAFTIWKLVILLVGVIDKV